jgi:D-alanyl-D-alanine dipeptidase
MSQLAKGFSYLGSIDNTILHDIKYATNDNLFGHQVAGYFEPKCIVSDAVGQALKLVQKDALSQGYSLLVYEAYRPLRAVEDFVFWGANPHDQKMKATHYPNVDKAKFFELGYVGLRSFHCRGAAVDVTLVPKPTDKNPNPKPLDMGTIFDFMDVLSHTHNSKVSEEGKKNRKLLCDLMHAHGFQNYDKEWWHFNLIDEPFPTTYFDFVIA